MKDLPCFIDDASKSVVEKLCAENNIDSILIQDLCEIMMEHSGAGRKEGVIEQFNQAIDRFLMRSEH